MWSTVNVKLRLTLTSILSGMWLSLPSLNQDKKKLIVCIEQNLTYKSVDVSYCFSLRPSVQQVNEYAPSHSRLTRDLILVTDPRVCTLPRLPKGGVWRPKALKMFSEQIKALYRTVGHSDQDKSSVYLSNLFDPDGQISPAKLCSKIKKMAEDLIERPLNQSTDLFKQGCDR